MHAQQHSQKYDPYFGVKNESAGPLCASNKTFLDTSYSTTDIEKLPSGTQSQGVLALSFVWPKADPMSASI